MSERTFVDSAKVFGKGKIQVPKAVRIVLDLEDGDKVIFYKDSQDCVSLEKAPKLEKESWGKYDRKKRVV